MGFHSEESLRTIALAILSRCYARSFHFSAVPRGKHACQLFYVMYRIEGNGNGALLTVLAKVLADFRHKHLRNLQNRLVFPMFLTGSDVEKRRIYKR